MKKSTWIILSIILVLLIGSLFLIPRNNKDLYMYTQIECVYTQNQLDSLCNSDGISNNLSDWDSTLYYEDSNLVKQYLYITEKEDTNIIYSLFKESDSTYFINKRVSVE